MRQHEHAVIGGCRCRRKVILQERSSSRVELGMPCARTECKLALETPELTLNGCTSVRATTRPSRSVGTPASVLQPAGSCRQRESAARTLRHRRPAEPGSLRARRTVIVPNAVPHASHCCCSVVRGREESPRFAWPPEEPKTIMQGGEHLIASWCQWQHCKSPSRRTHGDGPVQHRYRSGRTSCRPALMSDHVQHATFCCTPAAPSKCDKPSRLACVRYVQPPHA